MFDSLVEAIHGNVWLIILTFTVTIAILVGGVLLAFYSSKALKRTKRVIVDIVLFISAGIGVLGMIVGVLGTTGIGHSLISEYPHWEDFKSQLAKDYNISDIAPVSQSSGNPERNFASQGWFISLDNTEGNPANAGPAASIKTDSGDESYLYHIRIGDDGNYDFVPVDDSAPEISAQ